MKNYKIHLPEGMKDICGDELIVNDKIENILSNVFYSFGYEKIKTSLLEYINVQSDCIQDLACYKLINRNGEILNLRYDVTPSIMRYITNKNNDVYKFYYILDSYRFPVKFARKTHELRQAGIELIGVDNYFGEFELIEILNEVLNVFNISEYSIHFSHANFLSVLFSDLKVKKEVAEKLLAAIKLKDFVEFKNIADKLNLDIDVINLVRVGGRSNYLKKLSDNLVGFKSKLIIDELLLIYNHLEELGLSSKVIFDFGILPYGTYYSGLTFQVFIKGVESNVITGGRYDSDVKGLGFGCDLDAITSYITNNELLNIEKNMIYYVVSDSNLKFVFDYLSKYRVDKHTQIVKIDTKDITSIKKGKLIIFHNNEVEEKII